ncbi:hypothetical protein AB0K00_24080 [Dactylosporangium sp. NPDC049525]
MDVPTPSTRNSKQRHALERGINQLVVRYQAVTIAAINEWL